MSRARDRRRRLRRSQRMDDALAPRHYDRQGNPITPWDWSELAARADYRIIAQDWIGDLMISTSWHGIDLALDGLFGTKRLLFETIIMAGERQIGRTLHETEEEATAAHAHLVYLARQKAPGRPRP